jgi:hypothetical protein
MICSNCRKPFTSPQRSALFCSRSCKTASANFEAARGKQLYRLAYHWALGSGPSFSDLSWLVRQYIREDKEAGREPPPRGPTDMTPSQSYHTKRALKAARQRKLADAPNQ